MQVWNIFLPCFLFLISTLAVFTEKFVRCANWRLQRSKIQHSVSASVWLSYDYDRMSKYVSFLLGRRITALAKMTNVKEEEHFSSCVHIMIIIYR